jgi:ATP-binding cassette, subfamily F, member 3
VTQAAFGGVAIDFATRPLLTDVTFTVAQGERWGIVGRNGSGKTTLFRLINGELEPTRGTVARASGLRIAVLEQLREFAPGPSVWDVAAESYADLFALERSLHQQAARIAELSDRCPPEVLERYGRDLERFTHEGGYEAHARVDAVLHGLGFDPDAAQAQPAASLSGGEAGRLGLAREVAAPADLLLLDEPTNHLDLETTAWLESYLLGTPATVLVVSHDRAFLERVADHMLHLEAGTAIAYDCGYAEFLRRRAERRLSQERAYEQQRRTLAAEEDYIRRNIAGGNSKQAKGRRRRLERVERLSAPPGEEGAMAVRFQASSRGGDQVLVAEDARVAIGARDLVRDFSAVVRRGEVVGLVGSNGSGKSTLLRTIAGEREPADGAIRISPSLTVAHFRQDQAQVPAESTLYDIIGHLRPTWGRGPIQDHLGRFGFSGDEVLRRAGTLSGGERARVALAMLVLDHPHLLLLDEPTNHLDVESIEALEDALEGYDGTVILVSHDRELLRSVTTRTWVLRDGRIVDFPGGFAEWEAAEADRERREAERRAEGRADRRERDREREGARRSVDERRAAQSRARTAQRALETAEIEAHAAERRVSELKARLEDPTLYNRPDAAAQAAELSRAVTDAVSALEAALEQWARAAEAADAAERAAATPPGQGS